MRSIVDAGMPISEAATLFSILYRLTIGSVVSTRANHWSPWEAREALESLGAHRFPTLARVEREVDKTDVRGSFVEEIRRLIVDLGPQNLEGQPATSASTCHPEATAVSVAMPQMRASSITPRKKRSSA
jgi:hypothetical protein